MGNEGCFPKRTHVTLQDVTHLETRMKAAEIRLARLERRADADRPAEGGAPEEEPWALRSQRNAAHSALAKLALREEVISVRKAGELLGLDVEGVWAIFTRLGYVRPAADVLIPDEPEPAHLLEEEVRELRRYVEHLHGIIGDGFAAPEVRLERLVQAMIRHAEGSAAPEKSLDPVGDCRCPTPFPDSKCPVHAEDAHEEGTR